MWFVNLNDRLCSCGRGSEGVSNHRLSWGQAGIITWTWFQRYLTCRWICVCDDPDDCFCAYMNMHMLVYDGKRNSGSSSDPHGCDKVPVIQSGGRQLRVQQRKGPQGPRHRHGGSEVSADGPLWEAPGPQVLHLRPRLRREEPQNPRGHGLDQGHHQRAHSVTTTPKTSFSRSTSSMTRSHFHFPGNTVSMTTPWTSLAMP